MAKIYNIHSNTIDEEKLAELVQEMNKGKDVYMLNEDIRYEVIDFDKMTTLKSSNYTKNIYAMYVFKIKVIKLVFKLIIKVIKSPLNLISKLRR